MIVVNFNKPEFEYDVHSLIKAFFPKEDVEMYYTCSPEEVSGQNVACTHRNMEDLTQEELEIMRDQYGYNLTNSQLVDKLMKAYFLIAFVIVDPALQRVKFLFDGKSDYDTLTYATLAREATTNDKQFKEMVNMLGRRI